MHQAPQYPAGAHEAPTQRDMDRIAKEIELLAAQPAQLRHCIRGLTHDQLETRYRNWTVRQIVHHLADSTSNFFIRWKLALTEDHPTIKPYDEGHWVRLPDSSVAAPMLGVQLFEATVARWVFTAKAMRPEDFDRTFYHPQYQKDVALWQAISVYAWHGEHHMGQINWLRVHYHW